MAKKRKRSRSGGHSRRHRSNPHVRYHHKRRRRSNPHVRFHHRRRRHHNPMFASGGAWGHVGWGITGMITTRLAGNFAYNTFVPTTFQGPMVRLLTKGAVAWGVAWAGSKFFRVPFSSLFVGGMIDVAEDALANYVTPSFPMLSAYPQLSGYLSDAGQTGPYRMPVPGNAYAVMADDEI